MSCEAAENTQKHGNSRCRGHCRASTCQSVSAVCRDRLTSMPSSLLPPLPLPRLGRRRRCCGSCQYDHDGGLSSDTRPRQRVPRLPDLPLVLLQDTHSLPHGGPNCLVLVPRPRVWPIQTLAGVRATQQSCLTQQNPSPNRPLYRIVISP